MDEPGPDSDVLYDPRVKAYFLHLLASPFPDDVKYQKLVEFCAQQGLPDRVDAAEKPAAGNLLTGKLPEELQVQDWEMEELLSRTLESIQRAARRMQNSQHQDGGWGQQIEQSNFWHSAYAALFLKSAQEFVSARETAQQVPAVAISPVDIDTMLRRAAAYLEQHPEGWAPDALPGVGAVSVYDVSLMVRCFYRVGRPYLRREPALRVYRGLDRLYHAQNLDGGWDASIWGYEVSTPTQVWSEVGAASAALQALAETHDERFQAAMSRGMEWLAETQNPDGSWNDGSRHPALPAFQLEGQPSVVKTCDAIQGLLAGDALDLPLQPYRACVNRAVDWLMVQEKPVLERQRRITRWGWGYTAADYDNICLVLETLLQLPQIPPAMLAPYACWLVRSQRRQPDDPEDGCWVLGHTARIGLALAAFYRRAREIAIRDQVPWIPG